MSAPKLTGHRCQCTACGLHFYSVVGFDFHRRGPWIARQCMTEAELRAKGYEPNAAGFWRQPGPERAAAFAKEAA
jgi:hypothetical protein